MRRILLVALMVSVVFGVPSTINYQGKLTDASGVALNGYYNMEFRIYDAASGGTLLWSESHSSVPVMKGLFNVLLGETDPINLPFDGQYYLEIQVGSDVLTPRIPLSAVAYAFRANIADSVAGGAGQVLTLSFGSDDTLRLTQSVGSSFAVNIPVKEDDLSDNSVNDLGDVSTSGVSAGQVLKWNGSAWVPADDEIGAVSWDTLQAYYDTLQLQTSGSAQVHWDNLVSVPAGFADGVDDVDDADNVVGNEYNTALSFDDGTNTLSLTDGGGTLTATIDNEADDLSDNSIGDLGDVSTSGVSAGQVLKWDGSAWVPADDDTGTGGGGSSQWTATATYIYPDSAGEAVKIYNNGRVYADVSGGVSAGQAAVRGDVSATVWGALGYYDGTNYRAGEFSGDVEIINSGNLYVSGQIFDGDASDPDVNIGEDLTVSGDIDGNGDITINGSATFCAGGFGYVNVNNARIVNVAEPTAAQDAATKNYVDSNFLQTVNTSAPVVGNGTSGSPVTVATGGITTSYLADNAVTTAKIADEAVTAAKISASGGSEGQVLKVVSGVVQWADDEGGTAGVNSVTAGDGLSNSGTSSDPVLDVNAGDGLGISSDQLVVNVDGTTIEIASDQLRVPVGGIGSTQLADGAVTGTKIAPMGASAGEVLKWNGTVWAPATDNVNDADASATNEVITAFSYSDLTDTLAITEAGNTWKVEIDNEADDLSDNYIYDLSDVSVSSPSAGEVLKWNGSAWVNSADNTGTDDQTLSWSGSGPYLIDIEGTSNDAGVKAGVGISLSLTGDTLVITNTGDLSNTNELQTLSLSGANLTISSGNTVSFSGWDTDASNDLTTSTSFSGDVSGTYNSLNINSGVVGNSEIADATQFVDVYTNGSYRFSVTDGSQTLDFNEGTGIDISYNATGHDVTITHQDMSSQGSVNNSDGTVIQDVTLDYTGHVTGLASVNLDDRYAQGSGTSGRAVRWTGTRSVGNSAIYDDGSGHIGIGTNYNSNYRVYAYYSSDVYTYLASSTNSVYGYDHDAGSSSRTSIRGSRDNDYTGDLSGDYGVRGNNYNSGQGGGCYYSRAGIGADSPSTDPGGSDEYDYLFGLEGEQVASGPRFSGGVIGAYTSSRFGALAYTKTDGSYYGLYYNGGSGNGSGLLRSNPEMGDILNEPIVASIGAGGTGALFGHITRGEIYGQYVAGERYGQYVTGEVITNKNYTVLTDVGEDERIPTYAVTSPEVEVYTGGTGTISGREVEVKFDTRFARVVDPESDVIVTVTPIGEWHKLYIKEVKSDGFVVATDEEVSDARFTYIAIGHRRDSNPDIPEEVLDPHYDRIMKGYLAYEKDGSPYAIWFNRRTGKFEHGELDPEYAHRENIRKLLEAPHPGNGIYDYALYESYHGRYIGQDCPECEPVTFEDIQNLAQYSDGIRELRDKIEYNVQLYREFKGYLSRVQSGEVLKTDEIEYLNKQTENNPDNPVILGIWGEIMRLNEKNLQSSAPEK